MTNNKPMFIADTPLVGYRQYKIKLVKHAGGFRWRRSDGQWVSPKFSTIQAALAMAGKVMFLSDKEWSEQPAPKVRPVASDHLIFRKRWK
jgi:hypothetical protein